MRTTSLAAILFVDIQGFGERLAQDERLALGLLSAWRGLADPLVAEHGGEIVDATNDELLVLFGSAVAALQCALHLRLALRARNAGAAPGEAFAARCGLHLGEIWRDESRVYGNGVNVAARVKAEASGGEILASEDFHRQVSNKLDLPSRELPLRGLKNIERPLRLFLLDPEDGEGGCRGAATAPGAGPAGPDRLAPPAPPSPPPGVARPERPSGLERADGPGRPAGDERRAGTEPPAGPGRRGSEEREEPPEEREHAEGAVGRKIAAAVRSGLEKAADSGLGERIAREVERAIAEGADISVSEADGKRKFSLSLGEGHGAGGRSRRMAEGARKLAGGAAVTAGFLWAYFRWDNFWLVVGAALLGFFPAMSGLKKLLSAALDKPDRPR